MASNSSAALVISLSVPLRDKVAPNNKNEEFTGSMLRKETWVGFCVFCQLQADERSLELAKILASHILKIESHRKKIPQL